MKTKHQQTNKSVKTLNPCPAHGCAQSRRERNPWFRLLSLFTFNFSLFTVLIAQPECLTFTPESLDFGEVRLGESAELQIVFGNSCDVTLNVTDIATSTPELAVDYTEFTLAPEIGVWPVEVTFTPDPDIGTGPFTGSLTITSDDPGDPDFELPVSATAIAEPIINVSTDSLQFDVVVFEDTLVTQTLTIENTGFDTLEVNLSNSQFGYALEFDGVDDYVIINNPIGLNTEIFSIQILIKAPIQNTESRIINYGTDGYNQGGWLIGINTNGKIRSFQDEGINDWIGLNGNIVVDDNVGHNIVFTYNGSIRNIFIDGNLDNSISSGYNPNPSNPIIMIGKSTFNISEIQGGVFDEIKVWNIVINEVDISNNNISQYNNNLVAYWNFNEGSGNILNDLSGNGNHGTIYGATWVESPFSTSVDWISISESSISLPPGESADIELTANASGYELGDYEGSIYLTTNDPENLNIEIPVNMSVLYPIAGVEAESIDFGEAGFNSINNYELPITNGGNYPLEVNSSFSVGYSEFDILNDSLTVQPGDTGFVEIQLTTGLEEITMNDTLTLMTNDPSASSLLIPLSSTIVPDEHPIITTITDVPADQGGWVIVSFTRSYFDDDTLGRSVPEGYSVEMHYESAWVNVGSNYAYGADEYSILVHTPLDSTDVSDWLIDFRVIAAMEEGNFVSETAQGYSVDNIAPGVPENLVVQTIGLSAELYWEEVTDEDLGYYRIYRNEEFLGQSNMPGFTDTELLFGAEVEYVVTAVDIHGNESEGSIPYSLFEAPADVNDDNVLNVLDLILIVEEILDISDPPFTELQLLLADVNLDGTLDILDIVILIDIILEESGREVVIAKESTIMKHTGKLMHKTDGNAGFQITLTHSSDFTLELTEDAELTMTHTTGLSTTVIVLYPASELLFTTSTDFQITEVIAASGSDYIPITIVDVPDEFILKPAYPNPFNPVTTIEYGLPEDMDVNIRIYDMNGRLVDELVNTVLPAGYHTTVWNAYSHASGLYFISVSAEGIRQTQKLLLLK